jgi:hypothetical protein
MHPVTGISGNAAVLEDPGKTIIAYLPHGGSVRIDLADIKLLESRWFNPRTGEFKRPEKMSGGTLLNFHAPDQNDWVLLLNRY